MVAILQRLGIAIGMITDACFFIFLALIGYGLWSGDLRFGDPITWILISAVFVMAVLGRLARWVLSGTV